MYNKCIPAILLDCLYTVKLSAKILSLAMKYWIISEDTGRLTAILAGLGIYNS